MRIKIQIEKKENEWQGLPISFVKIPVVPDRMGIDPASVNDKIYAGGRDLPHLPFGKVGVPPLHMP